MASLASPRWIDKPAQNSIQQKISQKAFIQENVIEISMSDVTNIYVGDNRV